MHASMQHDLRSMWVPDQEMSMLHCRRVEKERDDGRRMLQN